MKILALDASGIVATVAIASEKEIIAEYTIKYKKTHSQTLLPMIEQVVNFAEISLKDIEYVAVTEGPGSFTGLRIGASTAKGLTQALNIPIVNIPTLEALAYNIVDTDKVICSIMDARRDNVFYGIYRRNGDMLESLCIQDVDSIENVINRLNELGEDVIFVGDGVNVQEEYIKKHMIGNFLFAPIYVREQKASSVIGLAFEYIKNNKYIASKDFEPVYLRKSQAERELEKKLQK